jgi:hypothetical protein
MTTGGAAPIKIAVPAHRAPQLQNLVLLLAADEVAAPEAAE